MNPETKLQSKCEKLLRDLNILYYPTRKGNKRDNRNMKYHKHWPDDMIYFPFCPTAVEYKQLGGKPSKGQLEKHRKLNKVGIQVYVIDNYEDFVKLVQSHIGVR
jgi:hypothetical protein